MAGISNRSKKEEDDNQRKVEARKSELPDFEMANRARKDHPIDKDREAPVEGRGRISETGAGRGLEHKGH
jgi:hypothetical protein